jgi:hypothetical protein
MEDDFQYKRLPAVPKKIKDINPEKDIRVRLLGRVLDKNKDFIVLDDGSGKANIMVDGDVNSDFVRVFARVLPVESGFELKAEIIQDMSKLDLELYEKAMRK